jgi:hypothetical protein
MVINYLYKCLKHRRVEKKSRLYMEAGSKTTVPGEYPGTAYINC